MKAIKKRLAMYLPKPIYFLSLMSVNEGISFSLNLSLLLFSIFNINNNLFIYIMFVPLFLSTSKDGKFYIKISANSVRIKKETKI